ncbi:MAG TPA: sialidase family protein [Blastocatellia bacterium]|nr:sialidase family protein [Blastocatellia bacterium]
MRGNSIRSFGVLLAATMLIATFLPAAAFSGKRQTSLSPGRARSGEIGAPGRAMRATQDGAPAGEHAWLLEPGVFEHLSSSGKRVALYMNGLLRMPQPGVKGAPREQKVAVTPEAATPFQNVRVTNDDGLTHSETSIATTGQNIVETFNQTPGAFGTVSGYSLSTDGGATFAQKNIPETGNNQGGGDGVVTFGGTGTLYYSEITVDSVSDHVGVARSTDGGADFSATANASPSLSQASTFQDKPWLVADNSASSPHKGTVYVSWTDITQRNGEFVVAAHSTDGGLTFSRPVTVSAAGLGHVSSGSVPCVDQNGNVYVAYLDFIGPSVDVAKSTDGGVTFGAPVIAGTLNAIGMMTGGGGVRDNEFPSMTVDQQGRIHVVFDAATTIGSADRSDIYYVRSTDGGATFTPRQKMNDDQTTTSQYMPSIVAAPNGNLGAIWYDRRNDTVKDVLNDVYMTISTDGGSSFSKNFRVTDHNWVNGPIEPGFAASYHGDYIQIAADANNFYCSFSDERGNGPDAYVVPVPLGTNPLAPDFNISPASVYGAVAAGNSVQFDVNASGVNGFTGNVAMAADIVTSGAGGLSFSFSAPAICLGPVGSSCSSQTSLTVSTTAATPPGTYLVAVTGTAVGLARSTNVRITVYPQNAPGSPPVNASNTSGFSAMASGLHADSSGNFHLVFDDDTGVGAGGNNVDYTRSTDGGRTYSAPIVVSTSADAFDSTGTVDSSGRVYAAWTGLDVVSAAFRIFVSSSSDHGNTFSTPVAATPISQTADLARIATDASGNLTIAYLEFSGNTALFTTRSTDHGATFSSPLQVSGNKEVVSTLGDSIAFNSSGKGFIAYINAAATPTLRLATAADGLNFTAVATLSDGVTPADAPSVTVDNNNEVFISFYEVLQPPGGAVNREVMLIKSCDGGTTFGPALNISQNSGQSRFPAVGVDSNGTVYVAWEDTAPDPQNDILLARSNDGGASFTFLGNISANQGVSIAAALSFDQAGNVLVAWTDDDTAETDIFTSVVPALVPGPGPTPDFSVVFGTSEFDVTRGSTVTIPVFISRTSGFSGNVTVNPSNAGALKLKVKPFSKATTCSGVSFTVKVKGGARVGSHGLVFTATDGTGRTRTGTLNLVIN